MTTVSTSQIIEYLHYFFTELLPSAYQDGRWTNEGLDRAVVWAEYCEKVAQSVDSKPEKLKKLERILRVIAEKSMHFLPFCTIYYVRRAKDVLLTLLLQNNLLDKTVHDHVKDLIIQKSGEQKLKELEEDVAKQLVIYKDLLSEIRKHCPELMHDIKVSLFFVCLSKQDLEQENCQHGVKQKLLSFLKEDSNFAKLIWFLISSNKCDDPEHSKVRLKKFIVKYLCEILAHSSDQNCQTLWQQLLKIPKDHLAKLCSSYREFLHTLLLELKLEGEALKPEYTDIGYTWKKDKNFHALGFDDIVHIYSAMIKEPQTGAVVRKKVSNWGAADGGIMWVDLQFKVKE
ncbi:ubiquitin-fold modifier 1 isoform X1 [Oratosquilla oratoria]|uniref:ubiquitin-fold modifier 1 isoform X1 n=1 Tax=Oratosquilla oratoria TaxID=337810 RepID=UPI003F7779AE